MKKVLFLCALLVGVIFAFPAKAAAESINNFEATYNLLQSGMVEVTEKIEYDFGAEDRHGIYRFIPYKYGLDNGEYYYIKISDVSVTDLQGRDYIYNKYNENNNVVLKIGDPDATITGVHTYIISYKVAGALRYLDSGDEFYWNVNGTGWDVPVERISAEITFENPVETAKTKVTCYRGVYSSTTKCAEAKITTTENQDYAFGATFSDKILGTYEGLSIVVSVPVGTFAKLDAGFMGSGLSDGLVSAMVIVALIIPVIVFIFMLNHWWKHGRDPKGRGTIVAEYDAPDGLTPIEVGTLLDNRVDNKDFSAEMIYLATKGLLKIRREAGKGIFKKDDYTLIKIKDGANLPGFDSTLMSGIFGTGNEVKISALKNEFYTHLASIKSQVHDKLVKDEYFQSRIATTIGKYLAIAFGVGFVGFGIGSGMGALTNGVGGFIFVPSFIVSAIIVALFGLAMPARTQKGVDTKERILGLKEYMRVAESDRIKFHNAPKKDPKIFEKLLPYAMVLGVEKEWAEQFKDIYKGNPGWYDDPSGRIFVPVVFVDHLNSFSTFATQNMTSSPSSSGSGFGGGGFSGGGFGGGGGGSW